MTNPPRTPPPPPRRGAPHPDDAHLPGAEPADVGTARMLDDGTLHLQLRSVGDDGTIAECLLVVGPTDPRHASFREHLGGIMPGQSRSIPPFPGPEVDPDSV